MVKIPNIFFYIFTCFKCGATRPTRVIALSNIIRERRARGRRREKKREERGSERNKRKVKEDVRECHRER